MSGAKVTLWLCVRLVGLRGGRDVAETSRSRFDAGPGMNGMEAALMGGALLGVRGPVVGVETMLNVDEARVRVDALGSGGEDG